MLFVTGTMRACWLPAAEFRKRQIPWFLSLPYDQLNALSFNDLMPFRWLEVRRGMGFKPTLPLMTATFILGIFDIDRSKMDASMTAISEVKFGNSVRNSKTLF